MSNIDPTNKSKLSEIAKEARKRMVERNNYKDNSNEYGPGNPDLIADGDEKGRLPGDSGQAGTSIDMAAKKAQLAKNIYGPNNRYRVEGE